MNTVSIIIAIVACLALAAALAYFLVFVPRKRRRPLLEALALITPEEASAADLEKAEKLLDQALTAGLNASDVADTRFALAYVRARGGRHSEASAIVSELRTSGADDRETVYLELWLKSREKAHDDIERLFAQHRDLLGNFIDTTIIVGIAYLDLALRHWDRREIDAALAYFDKLRQLGVLTDEIPKHVDDHQLVHGVSALIEKDFDEARARFQGAVDAATNAGKPAALGKLGLLLCEWVEEDFPDVDAQLSVLLPQLDAEYGGSAAPAADKQEEIDSDTRLRRNVRLWFALSKLFTWMRLPEKQGLPDGEQEDLWSRLDAVSAIDPDMGDPHLIRGLIGYYFADDDDARDAAIKALELAMKNEVSVPEVRGLVDRVKKIRELEAQGLERYLSLVKKYLKDKGVPANLRQQLRARLQQFQRFEDLGTIELGSEEEVAKPTLGDLEARGNLLRDRVQRIVKPKLAKANDAEGAKRVAALLSDLTEATKALGVTTKEVEGTEQRLMVRTGEFLLTEDAGQEPAPARRTSAMSPQKPPAASKPKPPPLPPKLPPLKFGRKE